MNISIIQSTALFMGILLGTVMLAITCWVYFRDPKMHASGIFFMIIGLTLLGLPIWRQIAFSMKDGALELSLIEQEFQAVEESYAAMVGQVENVDKEKEEISKTLDNLELALADIQHTIKAPNPTLTSIAESVVSMRARVDSIDKYVSEIDRENRVAAVNMNGIRELLKK
jgi:flagellar biosynthesis/type III secretory pathway chaperone